VENDFERRASVRVAVSLPIEVRSDRGFSLHSTRDVSATGCFFDRAIPHAVGARVALSFAVPGADSPIRCAGDVVNVPDTKGYGMGIQFVDISPDDARRIDAFVSALLRDAQP
jgi:uncharacterized protein (TIGR02266 family)